MSVVAWRVVQERYTRPPFDPFDGEGSKRFGGRWNPPGVPVVYTSGSRSLTILETLVHDRDKSALITCCTFSVTFDERLVTAVDLSALPANWKNPSVPDAVQQVGNGWIRAAKSPVLRVPSAVVDGEDNYILNPLHPRFGELKIGAKQPLPIDRRLLEG